MNAWRWRIASSEAGLAFGQFAVVNIAPPDLVEYKDHAQPRMVGDGSQRLYGYAQLTLFWDALSQYHWRNLRELTDQQISPIYMTIDPMDGTRSGEYYIDVSGFAHRPREIQRNSLTARTGPNIYTNIQLVLENVTILNSPSNYTVI